MKSIAKAKIRKVDSNYLSRSWSWEVIYPEPNESYSTTKHRTWSEAYSMAYVIMTKRMLDRKNAKVSD